MKKLKDLAVGSIVKKNKKSKLLYMRGVFNRAEKKYNLMPYCDKSKAEMMCGDAEVVSVVNL